jgi:hypothetical protein
MVGRKGERTLMRHCKFVSTFQLPNKFRPYYPTFNFASLPQEKAGQAT